MPPKKVTKASAAPAAKKAAATKKAEPVKKAAAAPKKTAAAAKPAAKPAAKSAAKSAAKPAAKPSAKPKPKAAPKKVAAAHEESDEDQEQDEEQQDEQEDEQLAPKPSRKSAPPTTKKRATPAPAVKRAASAQPNKASTTTSNGKKKAPTTDGDKENADPQPAGASSPMKRKREETVEPSSSKDAVNGDADAKEPPKQRVIKEPRPIKRARTAAPVSKVKIGAKINTAPTTILDVFVFGEGSSGELGLGSIKYGGKKPIDVKRPRLNHNLASDKVGVVQIACGGMHAIALTKDNKILTWGVNDQGALGRDTNWDGGLRDADADDSDSGSDDDDSGLNPRESTPEEVDMSEVAEGTRFVQVAASDSASFALTEDGRIYGWGTFRASDGILGFTPTVKIQKFPALLPEPKKVVQIAAGSNHVMALDSAGKLFTWGCPEQNQLGRRCVQRDVLVSALRPGGVGLKRGVKVVKISCGSYHSFALDKNGVVYAWGLNNFGELAIEQGAGDSDAAVLGATKVEALENYKIVDICGGEHHSVACTDDGRLLTWGRIDGYQTGLPADAFNEENAIYDESKRPRILKVPTVLPNMPKIVAVAAGTDNSFALTADGKAYSWGFSINYQTGQGTSDDIETPTLIDNTAVNGKKIIYAGAGGQYSILASATDDKA